MKSLSDFGRLDNMKADLHKYRGLLKRLCQIDQY